MRQKEMELADMKREADLYSDVLSAFRTTNAEPLEILLYLVKSHASQIDSSDVLIDILQDEYNTRPPIDLYNSREAQKP